MCVQGFSSQDEASEVSELEEYVMMAAQAQDQVKYGIVRDPKVVAKMEAAAEAQYATPSIHLFRRLDKQNLTMPDKVRSYHNCGGIAQLHISAR